MVSGLPKPTLGAILRALEPEGRVVRERGWSGCRARAEPKTA